MLFAFNCCYLLSVRISSGVFCLSFTHFLFVMAFFFILFHWKYIIFSINLYYFRELLSHCSYFIRPNINRIYKMEFYFIVRSFENSIYNTAIPPNVNAQYNIQIKLLNMCFSNISSLCLPPIVLINFKAQCIAFLTVFIASNITNI